MSDEKTLSTSKKLHKTKSTLPDKDMTLMELINYLSTEGVQMLVIILIAPFLLPASIPGSSTPFGILIILLQISYLRNKSLYLPNFIGKYVIANETVIKLFEILEKALTYVEKISKPRGNLSENQYVLKFNSIIVIILALLLFLPLPIPFTDFLPAVSILVLSVSTLEKDSYLMLLGYLFTIGTIIYFASVGYVGIELIKYVINYFGKYVGISI